MEYDPYATALELLDKGGTVREDLGERERAALLAAVERMTAGSAELARLLLEHQPPRSKLQIEVPTDPPPPPLRFGAE